MDTRRYAVVWSTDGGDHEYWRHSVASFRAAVRGPADFFVFALPSDDLHGIDEEYGLARIDPSPYLDRLDIRLGDYADHGGGRSGRWRWPGAIFYKLCAPVADELVGYESVLTLDTDTLAMPTSRRYTVDDLLRHPLGDFEVAGVPDMYEVYDRTAAVMESMVPDCIRGELEERLWSRFGRGCQMYVNAGVLLWNPAAVRRDLDWYARRCAAFWGGVTLFEYPEQDFINACMAVDSRLQTGFGARGSGNGPYIVADACIRHFTGMSKHLMLSLAGRMPEAAMPAGPEDAWLRPRGATRRVPPSPRRCIVWARADQDYAGRRVGPSVASLREACGERLGGIDLFLLADGEPRGFVPPDGVRVLDISGLYDLSGFRAVCNWRSGHLSWDRARLARLFVPFVPELQGYDLAMFLDGGVTVSDPRMLDLFDEDVSGYDYAMAAVPSGDVRFCRAFLQGEFTADHSVVAERLASGVFFDTSVFLANMAEARRTFRSLQAMCRMGVSCIGSGAPAVEQDLINSVCVVKRVSGSYSPVRGAAAPGDARYCSRSGM